MPTTHIHNGYTRRVVILIALVALALVLWRITDVLLLFFGALLASLLLHALADPIERRSHLSPRLSLAISGSVILTIIVIAGWSLGTKIEEQMSDLAQRVPEAWRAFERSIGSSRLGRAALLKAKDIAPDGQGMITGLSFAAVTVAAIIGNALLMIFGGIYLAAQPKLYRDGLLQLIPRDKRRWYREVFDCCGRALKLWLLGKLIAMLIVGILVTIGLWAIGVPSALGLGLLAGLGEFVPLLGILAAAIPAVLIAFAEGSDLLIWTILIFAVVQMLEGNIITPLIEHRIVYLPPALTLFSIVTFSVLLGPLGFILAAPLTVVVFVAIKKLYIQDTLGELTKIPGETP